MPTHRRPRSAALRLAFAIATAATLALPAFAAMPDFGPMRTYQIAFIRRGPAWTPERAKGSPVRRRPRPACPDNRLQ